MVAYSWSASVSNDWANAAAWTPTGGPPTSSSAVTIATATAGYGVKVDSSDAAGSLTLSSATATLTISTPAGALAIAGALSQSAGIVNIGTSASPSGTLTVGGGASLSGGTLNIDEGGLFSLTGKLVQTGGAVNLNAGGTLSGGVIDVTGGAFGFKGGTLSGATYDGPLNLTATGASVHLANGAEVVGSSGTGVGAIDVTGKGAILYFDGAQTVANVTIDVGASAGSATVALYHVFNPNNASETLTLASTTTVDFTGYGALTGGNFGGDGLVNQGLIEQTSGLLAGIAGSSFTNAGTLNAADAGGTFAINSNNFTNSGKINVSNGDQLVLASFNSTVLTATSVIAVGAGSELTLSGPFNAATWSNLGSIALASGSTLDLGGEFTLADVGKITNNGGAAYVVGTLLNAGQTLDGSGALGAVKLYGGTILGGIVKSAGVAFATVANGSYALDTLDDTTFYGPLNLTGQNQDVALTGGTTIVGSTGTGAGVVNVSGVGAELQFGGTQTVSNLTVNISGASGPPNVGLDDINGVSSKVTLASTATLDFVGNGDVSAGFNLGDSLVNEGLIEQTKTGSADITGTSFTNSGAIDATAAGSSFWIGATTFVNSGTITISGGDQLTLAGSNSPGSVTTLSATSKVSVGSGGTLVIGSPSSFGGSSSAGTWTNLGAITLASGSTLDLEGTFTLASLGAVTNNGGSVFVVGTLNNAGQTLNGSGALGAVTLDGGTVSGGIVTSAGLNIKSGGPGYSYPATLSGVTFEGPLNLTGQDQDLSLTGGTTIVGSTGTGPGVINLSGNFDTLNFEGTQTVAALTVKIGGLNAGEAPNIDIQDAGLASTLTLASSATIDFVGAGALYAGFAFGLADSLVNQGTIEQTAAGNATVGGLSFTNSGTISAAAAGGLLSIDPTTFVNSGTINISNGDEVALATGNGSASSTSLTATSKISIGAGSTLAIGSPTLAGNTTPSGSFSNLGSIALASGATLALGGTFTLASLGSIANSGGVVEVVGTLNNTGKTLNGAGGIGALTLDQGTVEGGIATSSGLTFGPGFIGFTASTLSGVTFEGPLSLTGQNADVVLTGGTTITGSSGTGAGVAHVTGANAELAFAGAQTVANLTVNLGSSYENSQLFNDDSTGAGQTLTLAASTTVDFVGFGNLNADYFSGDSIVNQGLIDQTGALGSAQIQGNAFTNAGTLDAAGFDANLQIDASTFTNTGSIDVSNQDFVSFGSQTDFTNFASGTLTGGVYDVAGGTIQIQSSSALTTLAANLTLSGSGSFFDLFNPSTNAVTSLDTSLTTIAASGSLSLLDFRNWTTSGAPITDKGVITLGGGAIDARAAGASFALASGGQLNGYGELEAASVTNAGTITASGGALQLNSAVTGTGALKIGAGAKLVADDAVASTQTVSFQGAGGALEFLSPNTFGATIDGFTAGDTLLTSASFVSLVENTGGTSATLTLTSGTTTDHITLVGAYTSSLVTHSTSGGITTIGYA